MTRRQLTIARILLVLYLVALFWLCFGHFDSMPDVKRYYWGIPTDKIVHFLMFLPFPILAYFAFDRYTEKFWSSVLWTGVAFLAGVLLAAGTEVGQAFLTNYRSGDPNDFRADLLALGISTLLVFILDLRKQR